MKLNNNYSIKNEKEKFNARKVYSEVNNVDCDSVAFDIII